MRPIPIFIACMFVLGTVTALGLDGEDGYTATALFTTTDVESDLAEWSGVTVHFGMLGGPWNVSQEEMCVNSSGEVFVYVFGRDAAGGEYNGVIRYDPEASEGSRLDTILKEDFLRLPNGDWYDNIECITVSPVTAGRLTADHLVIVRNRYDFSAGGFYLEVVSVDPDSSSTETSVFDAAGGGRGLTNLAIDGSTGDLFLLEGRAEDAPDWGGIRKFHWSGGSYTETAVTGSGKVQWGLAVGPDGDVYSFDAATTQPQTILRIDPSGYDTWSVHASFENSTLGDNRFKGWSFDSEGRFWIAMLDIVVKKGKSDLFSFVTEVPDGGTVRMRDRIAGSHSAHFDAVTTGPSEKIYVIEHGIGDGIDTVYEIAPPEDGGGGNGKGKKK
jgi:hypothetical protein